MNIYVVKPDDTVDKISEEQNTDLTALIRINQLTPPYRLAVGQALLLANDIPSQTFSPYSSYAEAIFRSGYAYPFISAPVLTETLSYLSELAVFSYGFTLAGDLIPPAMDDTWMTAQARQAGVTPALTLTPLGSDGHFNNALVTALVHSRAAQQRLVTGLASVMLEKGYQTVNIDFEYVLGEDKNAFTAFVSYATYALNILGYQVSVALAPKYSDDQPGVLYEGMDYAGLGAAANWVVLMTYEWGYTYGPVGLW